jgi:hypothetical protein
MDGKRKVVRKKERKKERNMKETNKGKGWRWNQETCKEKTKKKISWRICGIDALNGITVSISLNDIQLIICWILKENQTFHILPGKMIDPLVRCHGFQQMGFRVHSCPQQVKVRNVWMNLKKRQNTKCAKSVHKINCLTLILYQA